MPGDKLTRVKSIKKWLDKAEESYSSHKDISGELNLIMAQAEMQRLKETHPHAFLKKWGVRFSAMAVAVMLFAGFSGVSRLMYSQPPAPVISQKENGIKENPIVVPEEKNNMNANAVIQAKSPQDARPEITASVPAITEEAPSVPARAEAAASVQLAPVMPVMSQSEIQSVVGEAGRALRGQP